MKFLSNYSTVYSRPTVDVVIVEAEGVLCASSEELDDIQKGTHDFGWEN